MKKFLASKIFRLIWSLGLAAVLYFLCPPCFAKTTLAIILGILLVLVNGAPWIGKWNGLTQVARVLVGGLFIFSGFIKANDPLGFSYKLTEYFEVFQGDTGWTLFEHMASLSLPFAIILCASEIVLGIMLLLGYRRDLTLWLLFAQIAFFTFLTFYSACFNKVTHCGCFGDFLKLLPWQSFWKDIALLILITLLFSGKDNIRPLFTDFVVGSLFVIGLVFSVSFPIYAFRNLPPLDFRAYAPGMSIKDNMKKGEGYKDPVYQTVLVYENLKTKELKEFSQDEYMKLKIWEDTLTWKWSATDNKLISEAVNPPKITDFTVNDVDGNNISDSVLNNKNYSFWIIMHQLSKTNTDEELMHQVNDFAKLAKEENVQVIAFTSSGSSDIEAFKKAQQAEYDFVIVDDIVLKTMIRSNPGLMLMKDGKVIMNWHHNNFPGFSDVKQKYMK